MSVADGSERDLAKVSGMTGAERLTAAFSQGPALLSYLMAGYPSPRQARDAIRQVVASGADVIELGVPYADALADGPVIVQAADAARAAALPGRFGLEETIATAALLTRGEPLADDDEAPATGILPTSSAAAVRVPIVVMTYYNPIRMMGVRKAAHLMVDAGIAGVIVADMPPESARAWLEASTPLGLATVFLVAPTSTPERIARVCAASSGFVYYVSSLGVTGERVTLAQDITTHVGAIRTYTDLPIAVGFGISSGEQAHEVAGIADGVIVGSGNVRRQTDIPELAAFTRSLVEGVHAVRG
jgi:tryptophan synthase alpha chain